MPGSPAACAAPITLRLSIHGWAARADTWQAAQYCDDASDSFQWLQVAGHSDHSEAGPVDQFAITPRLLSSVTTFGGGVARTATRRRAVAIGLSVSSEPSLRLPEWRELRNSPTNACVARGMDDFAVVGNGLELRMGARHVAAGSLLQLIAVPKLFDGGGPAGGLEITFTLSAIRRRRCHRLYRHSLRHRRLRKASPCAATLAPITARRSFARGRVRASIRRLCPHRRFQCRTHDWADPAHGARMHRGQSHARAAQTGGRVATRSRHRHQRRSGSEVSRVRRARRAGRALRWSRRQRQTRRK